jgi:hypothetical protein
MEENTGASYVPAVCNSASEARMAVQHDQAERGKTRVVGVE